MALTEIPIELSSTPSIVDGGNATAITISSAELVTVANGLTLTDGNVVVANGHGIDFSATSGSGTSELLSDYEEGTWTPAPSSGGFSTVTATYTKVGRLVTVRYFCLFNSAGSGGSAMTISGLPFNVINSNSGYAPGITMVDNLTTATNNMTIQATINSSTFILIGGNGSTGDHVGAAASLFSSGSSFRGTLVYETA